MAAVVVLVLAAAVGAEVVAGGTGTAHQELGPTPNGLGPWTPLPPQQAEAGRASGPTTSADPASADPASDGLPSGASQVPVPGQSQLGVGPIVVMGVQPTATTTVSVPVPGKAPASTPGAAVTTSSPPLPSGGSFEAEASANTLTGRTASIACPGCHGGARIGYVQTSSTLTLTGIRVASAGTYRVTVYYTNGETDSLTALFGVNGASVLAMSLGPTGSYNTPVAVTVPLPLVAGINTISFSNPSGSTPDLDRIVVPPTP
ncbi:hypothetical protein [Kitasatospora sp. NE20-6]|uniref:hypothetical protein n=1 Tax=Kitasatospora sp. NE20-6 TaxID=2859066 RepID=UPI0038B350F8